MTDTLNCPECGMPINVAEHGAVSPFACPHCSKLIEAPKPDTPDSIDPTEPPRSEIPKKQTVACPFCGEQILKRARKCKHCGETKRKQKKIKTNEFLGVGSLIQLVGIGAGFVFAFPIGVMVGIVLFAIGSTMNSKWTCGSCGNKLQGANVKKCPTCGSRFN